MTSCRFWGSEGLKTYATYFHALAWGIPALASVAAITLKQVNGDELLGICFVGTLNPWAQLYLVILPQGILLTLGTTFIGLGFISLFRIRNAFRREFPSGQNSERLMLRLGVFSVLSTLPALFVLGCRLHAHFKHQEWAARAAHDSASCETGWNKQSCGPRQSHPQIEMELLKIFMSLIIGVTSGIWVWSRKTVSHAKEHFCAWRHSIVFFIAT
ncbi:UNVERIFIED_CONTAM: hypothetical protein GTU68_064246 [Idotea baltica]|nr:hypothetical protein [Idotea baltica]